MEFLRYQYNLSDRQVIARAKTDLSFRYFLQVDQNHRLVDPSLLCLFRGRLGRDGIGEKISARRHRPRHGKWGNSGNGLADIAQSPYSASTVHEVCVFSLL